MTSPFPDDLISAYLDGELNAEERARVEEQLRDDARLQRLYEELRALRVTLQSIPVAGPSEGFSERVLRRAERRMLLGEGEANPAELASRGGEPDDVDRAVTEKRPPRTRHWRFIVPLVSTVAAVFLVAVFLFDHPLSFRAKHRVAQGVDGEVAERAGTPADGGGPAKDHAKPPDRMAETLARENASDALGTADEAAEKRPFSSGARDMSRKATGAMVEDRAAGSDMQRLRKKAGAPAPRLSRPSADQDGSASDGLSLDQQQYGYGLSDKESGGKTEPALEDATVGGSASADRLERQGPGPEGGKPRHSHQRTLETREPAAAGRQSTPSARGSRQPAPAAPRFGLGMSGMGGGVREEMSKHSDAPGELAAQPPMVEEPAESAAGTDSSDEAGDSRATSPATIAWHLAKQLEVNESLWVQVSVSHDAKMELLKSERNGEEKGRPWRAAARRLLGTEEGAPVKLNVSPPQGWKLPAKNLEDPALRYSDPSGRVILVEGTKQTLRGSLERLVSRSDIRINQVSKTSARELEHLRGLVEPLVERSPAQPIKVDSFPVDKTIDEAVRKSVSRMRAAPSKTPATETILHFVFRCTSGAPDAAARESPSGSTPVGDPPESESTRDDHE